jgi:hypothetical protein
MLLKFEKNKTLTMQILEIWNNFFAKVLQIHSSFLSYLFLIFCELRKNQNLMSFIQI